MTFKKILILPLLFLGFGISFGYESDLSPAWLENSVVNMNFNNGSVTTLYFQGGQGDTSMFYRNVENKLVRFNGLDLSSNQLDSGSIINADNLSLIYTSNGSSSSSIVSDKYVLFSVGLVNNLPLVNFQNFYFQRRDSSGVNLTFNTAGGIIDPTSSDYTVANIGKFYLRNFYGGNSFSENPRFFEVFSPTSQDVVTPKARIKDSSYKNVTAVVPGLLDGYSYITQSGDSFSFHTVFPGLSDNIPSGSLIYSLNSTQRTDSFLMFPLDGDKFGSSTSLIGVLAKISTGYAFSEYTCSGLVSTCTEDGDCSYNFSTACRYLDGGYSASYSVTDLSTNSYFPGYKQVTPEKIFSSSIEALCSWYPPSSTTTCLNDSSVGFNRNIFLDYNGRLYISAITSNKVRESYYSSTGNLWSGYYAYIYFNLDGGVDVLRSFNYGTAPFNPSNPNSAEKIFNSICQLQPWNPFCQSTDGGTLYLSGSYSSVTTDCSNGTCRLTITDFSDADHDWSWAKDENGNWYTVVSGQNTNVDYNTDDISTLTGIENEISRVVTGFKLWNCPYQSALGELKLSSISSMTNFLLDKRFDVDLIGPISCFYGGMTHSILELKNRALNIQSDNNGVKFLDSLGLNDIFDGILIIMMFLIFWRLKPKTDD